MPDWDRGMTHRMPRVLLGLGLILLFAAAPCAGAGQTAGWTGLQQQLPGQMAGGGQPPAGVAAPPAARVDGISDQNLAACYPTPFGSEVFGALWAGGPAPPIRYARYVVPWQAGESAASSYRTDFYAWRESAMRAGLQTDLAITLYSGNVPSPAQYRAALSSLLAGHGVQYLEAWNEPNRLAQLRADESLAPEYMREAAAVCAQSGCEPIAGDFLDEAGSARFASSYRRRLASLGVSARLWGIHPYAYVNDGDGGEAMAIAQHLGPGQELWITEAGAYYCFASRYEWPAAVAAVRQREAVERLIDTVAPDLGASNVFYYGLFAGRGRSLCPTEDTDLYDSQEALRPAGRVMLSR